MKRGIFSSAFSILTKDVLRAAYSRVVAFTVSHTTRLSECVQGKEVLITNAPIVSHQISSDPLIASSPASILPSPNIFALTLTSSTLRDNATKFPKHNFIFF
ncbi:hypothetical protein E4U23_003623 [Claviceps purpurea]|nr:hypothetical protein E4U23_003623 [Claviceps purpurea]